MQQLSLFDFGEEAPKPEKKKKTSKDGAKQAGSTPDNASTSNPSTEQPTPSKKEAPVDLKKEQERQSTIPIPPDQTVEVAKDGADTLQASQVPDETIEPSTGEKPPVEDPGPAVTSALPTTSQQADQSPMPESTKPPAVASEKEAVVPEANQHSNSEAVAQDADLQSLANARQQKAPQNATASFELHPPQQNEQIRASDLQEAPNASNDHPLDVAKQAAETPNINAADSDVSNAAIETKSEAAPQKPTPHLQGNLQDDDELLKNTDEPTGPVEPAKSSMSATEPPVNTKPANQGELQDKDQKQKQDEGQDQLSADNQSASGVVFANEQLGAKVVIKQFKSVGIASYNKPPAADKNNTEELAPAKDIQDGDANKSRDNKESDTHQTSQQDQQSAIDTSFSPDDLSNHNDPNATSEQKAVTDHEDQVNEVAPANNTGLPTIPEVIEQQTAPETQTKDKAAIEAPDQPAEETNEPVDNQSERESNEVDTQEELQNDNAQKPYYIEDQTTPVKKRGRKSFKEIDAEVDLINVPPDEELFQKQYYPISVVAKWFRVNNSLLRFWENEFKILKPRKNKKGDRFFRPEDVKNLQLIYYLLRQKKLTINGAIKHLNAYKEQTEVNMQLIQTLNEFKGFLLELRAATEK